MSAPRLAWQAASKKIKKNKKKKKKKKEEEEDVKLELLSDVDVL